MRISPTAATVNFYPTAFELFGLCAAQGVALSVAGDGRGLEIDGEPPAPLMDRLSAFLGRHETRESSPGYAALRRLVRAPSLAVRELLTVPVRFLGSYPAPYTARGRMTMPGNTSGVVAAARAAGIATAKAKGPPMVIEWAWSTSRTGFDALVKAGVAAFTAKELERAAYALEHGRAGPREMARWCASKVGRDWVLTPEHAGADLPGYGEGKTYSSLTVGDLMDGLGAELVSVEWKE